VDDEGRPAVGAQVRYAVPTQAGNSVVIGSGEHRTDATGRFDVGPFAEDPRAGPSEPWSSVFVLQSGFATLRLEPRSVPPSERDRVTIHLTRGFTLAGVLMDTEGRPLADGTVAAEYGADWNLRRGARTDRDGRFRLERLTPGPLTLLARAFAHDAKARRDLDLTADDTDVRLVAEPIRLSRPPVTTPVLGVALADVDDELRAAYDVPDYVKVLIVDPGPDLAALRIGRLEKGYGLWMVGDTAVTSVRDAVERLTGGARRVVYTFWDERMSGTNTQHLSLTPEQLAALKDLQDRLAR
jgi:hypothetical protein